MRGALRRRWRWERPLEGHGSHLGNPVVINGSVATGRVPIPSIAGGPGTGDPEPVVVGGVRVCPTIDGGSTPGVHVYPALQREARPEDIRRITGIAAYVIDIHKMVGRRRVEHKYG